VPRSVWRSTAPAHGAAPDRTDRRCIVEKRLTFDQSGEPAGSADVAENGDHCGQVSRRHDRAKQKADDQRHAGNRPERQTDRRRRDKRGDDRQQ